MIVTFPPARPEQGEGIGEGRLSPAASQVSPEILFSFAGFHPRGWGFGGKKTPLKSGPSSLSC